MAGRRHATALEKLLVDICVNFQVLLNLENLAASWPTLRRQSSQARVALLRPTSPQPDIHSLARIAANSARARTRSRRVISRGRSTIHCASIRVPSLCFTMRP